MAISDSDQESSKDYNEGFEEEDYSSYHGSDPDYDSGADRSYSIEEETRAKLQNFSIKKKSRAGVAKDFDLSIKKDPEEMEMNFPEVDDKSYEYVQKIVKAGKLEKLKVDQCKVYLKKNGLRLSGRKDMLIQRIKEHLEILNGGGEKKYPLSSFILNCKGDACTGDVVMFEQNVYEMFNIASRSASGPPCGTRIVAGRIVKESYGAAKQQHTFTIEVLWSKGEKPLPPLHPLLIKGRNLYRLKTLRQKWEDEGERQKALMEKHSRGSLARSDREVRILEKERREMLRANRIFKKDERNKTQSQLTSTTIEIRPQQLGSSSYSGIVAPQHQQSGLNVVAEKLTSQTHGSGSVFDLEKPPIMSQQSGFLAEPQQLANQSKQSGLSVTPREKRIQLPEQSGFSPNFKAKSFQSEYKNVHVLQQLANQPKQSGLSVAPREKRIQLPEQSGFSPNFKARSFQSEYKNVHVWEGYQNQIPRYSVQSSGIPEVQLQKGDKFHIDYRKTNFHMNKYQNSINDKSRRSGMSKLLETSYHRHQLKSMNNCHPETPPQRRGFLSQQPCRYHAQGRCYYGENCKFLHETRELHGAEERRFWRYGHY
ncbi:PREDICTED: zinc finger CCCH domain-containing protein 62-like isoform X1 [Theobroma cacao]|uniref:Zinc finger CCCH domain-containing protein 62-like isoform X1 n=1 Tax=Theobroma cacao TaxID=3641 RepID=A0AB32WLK4_THECC|nr:PREDICTED: zinc finger CCCH domain-containing protein 62-like isoform X1 [Theobroma cacao]